ncbi:Erythronate-4-phosphate dehydrogenase [Sinobacterium norvegicum]|uniref:Erythronate-4-phosphate dehydrogenase n=1 Tax=Sinobacterium norvegicum TaxID=1641715 RepID=A0ABM9AHL1_9GAMM|nr:4-phosphoerythronate dehydrogenase [Sinobacterium norvegicum]CAH0992710.1 Erythronate-4-phosphate dehydrogenase [Sinobacterium norvegicum]
MLKIVADENIPLAKETFAALGEVVLLPGRNMQAADVVDADLLVVRSVTPVNQALLAGSQVKFVGTCTIGTDHVDLEYLDEQGIGFSNAPGCNAVSVVEYVIAALSHLWRNQQFEFLSKTVGIIGLGMVGGRLFNALQAMSVEVMGYDPLIDSGCYTPMVELEQVLACDIVCIHAPLTKTGPYPSEHMLAIEQLALLKTGAVLINAGRGGVIDNRALLQLLPQRQDLTVILDVFEGEPAIDLSLLPLLTIATPHIAGYSFDGKVAGTSMVYQAVCQHFDLGVADGGVSLAAVSWPEEQAECLQKAALYEAISLITRCFYDIANDDKTTRQSLTAADKLGRADEAFDQLRKQYPVRRQWQGLTLELDALDEGEQRILNAMLSI